MKNWLLSLHGAIVVSLLALLSNLWRGFLDAMFVLPYDFGSEGLMELAAIVFTLLVAGLLFSGWTWALFAAWRGSRRGLAATFAINALALVAIPISWLPYYCPAECRAGAGILNLANSLNLFFGLLAATALGLQFRREPDLGTGTARQG